MKSLRQFREDQVRELENGLKVLKKHDYNTIDNLMQKISKKHDITGKKLHNDFKEKHGKTPDSWIKEETEESVSIKKQIQELSAKLAEISRNMND